MSLAIAFTLSYLAFAAVCLSMRRHRDQVGPAAKRLAPWLLRTMGAVLFLAMTAVSVERWGPGVGPVYAIAIASAAGLGFILIFSQEPRGAVLAAAAPAVLSLILIAGSLTR